MKASLRKRIASRQLGGLPNNLPVIGVDPGASSGAAALLSPDGSELTWWATWTRMTGRKSKPDGWRIRSPDNPPVELPTMEVVLQWIALPGDVVPTRVIIEDLFIIGAKGNGKAMLKLAEQAGMCRMAFASPDMHRVLARVWRPSQLGLRASCKAADAERVALARARAVWRNFPKGGGYQHLAEACWIARYGCTAIPRATDDA